jgi:hypothetical protein
MQMTLEELRHKVCDYFGAYFKYEGNDFEGNLVHCGSNGRVLTAIIVAQCGNGGWEIGGVINFVSGDYWNDLMNLNREES